MLKNTAGTMAVYCGQRERKRKKGRFHPQRKKKKITLCRLWWKVKWEKSKTFI